MRRWMFLTLFFIGCSLSFPAAAGPAAAGSPPGGPAQVRFPAPRSDKQDPNAPRNLTGQVVDKEGKGLGQAVVHLKNKKTLEVKTRISDAEGKFLFRGLDPDVDYAVHAEYQGASSSTQTVSMFDDRKDIYLVLEIETTAK